ncbi:uncharacterized protein E5676_scaffold340G00170 [Cucumis melo var. makuwa]|uniref:Reverse transcriptase/retrotransposon-derived protein RNase H-like domain-containing protein n=1 Tax=Cucumis melo var. makuwa TaxID=1194695 RepID=A0A5A7SME6_CUCMM|nr:uncharacterized protein E6C27_scaffold219G002190 [Cucumis melo var. makuwa]TYK31627.1 uncharacterized protein E5676_scaffold340G00170 [Cucumis melo var. makuwa]
MVTKGIVLGHRISKARLEVDPEKIDVVSKLPLPSDVKSDMAIGSMLGEKKDKVIHLIYYASKTLNDAQENYTITEKKLLAVVFAIESTENQVADHLSRLNNEPFQREKKEIEDGFLDEKLFHVEVNKSRWHEPFLYKFGPGQILRMCVPEYETTEIIVRCCDGLAEWEKQGYYNCMNFKSGVLKPMRTPRFTSKRQKHGLTTTSVNANCTLDRRY